MPKLTQWSWLAAAAVSATLGCKSLEVINPNAPDAARAFSDPSAVAGLVTGAMRTWFDTRGSYYGGLDLVAMADSYSASWNNAQLRYYSSYGPQGNFLADCAQRCGWFNSTSDIKRYPIETFWYGFYGMLSSINDVLSAIRTNGLVLTDDATTKMHEAIAVMIQGIVFANIALNYDKGFVVTEATDISDPSGLPYAPREEMRDSAIAKFDQAVALLQASSFTTSPSTWTGSVSGLSYSSAQFIKLIRTMQADVLARFPRDAAENAAVNWSQVASYAQNGLDFDFNFFQELQQVYDYIRLWAAGSMRLDTRVATLITGAYPPALGSGPVFHDPYAGIEDQPNSADKRVGNGSWGPEDDVTGAGSVAADAGAGTDFAWTPSEVMRAERGPYHQSSMAHVRYSYLSYAGSGLPGETGRGPAPMYTATQNDLLWAEALIRGGGSATQAATLINKTRVGRGHLTPLTGAEGTATLLLALQYEEEVEEAGSINVFYNRRRATPEGWQLGTACPAIMCLWPGTPRQMPVPAKELAVLQQEIYSFGGSDLPDFAPSNFVAGNAIWSAKTIGDALVKRRPGFRAKRF
jgi:hypothetical protein